MTETEIVTVHVPFHIRKRGGRKEMILPDAALAQHRHLAVDAHPAGLDPLVGLAARGDAA